MTKLVMKIRLDGCNIDCIRTDDKYNPFRVIRVSGGHRRQIAKYGDFMSVIYFLRDFYQAGMNTMPMYDVIRWAKEVQSI